MRLCTDMAVPAQAWIRKIIASLAGAMRAEQGSIGLEVAV